MAVVFVDDILDSQVRNEMSLLVYELRVSRAAKIASAQTTALIAYTWTTFLSIWHTSLALKREYGLHIDLSEAVHAATIFSESILKETYGGIFAP
jgi:hypothetical protein